MRIIPQFVSNLIKWVEERNLQPTKPPLPPIKIENLIDILDYVIDPVLTIDSPYKLK